MLLERIPAIRRAGLHRPLVIVAAAMTVLCVVALGGLTFDDRTLLGGPIWAKTFKFTVSIALYTFTLAWMLALLPKARRWGWWLGTVIAAGLALEMVLIVGQTIVRGRRLHFNTETAADRFIHNLMATAIYVLWAASLVVALLLLFQRLKDTALASAVRSGVFLALLGTALGMLMFNQGVELGPSRPDLIGAHSVGVPDGGPGLPLLGWSTTGGDLRIPHFVGLHALQLLPLLAIGLAVLSRRYPVLGPEVVRRRLIRIAAAGYLALVVLLTWQALRGQSLIHPDGWTLLAGAGVLSSVLAASGSALRARDPR